MGHEDRSNERVFLQSDKRESQIREHFCRSKLLSVTALSMVFDNTFGGKRSKVSVSTPVLHLFVATLLPFFCQRVSIHLPASAVFLFREAVTILKLHAFLFRNRSGWAPIHLAAQKGHLDVIKAFGKLGVDLQYQSGAARGIF